MTAFAHPLANPALVVAALCAALSGWMALSLAMERHWQNQHGRGTAPSTAQRRALQLAGAAGLLVSNLVCLFVREGGAGWIAWLGMLTATALSAAWILSYAPQRSSVVAVLSALLAASALACGAALHAL
jgi:hypothetical protein